MPELRWTLLILGAVFIIGLALWEFRRQRHVPRQSMGASAPGSERVSSSLDTSAAESPRVFREPTITLPELHPEPRTVTPAPKLVELDAEAFSRAEGAAEEPMLAEPAPGELSIGDADIAASVTVETLKVEEIDGLAIETSTEPDAELEAELEAEGYAQSFEPEQSPEPAQSTGFVSDADHEEPQVAQAPEPAYVERHPAGASAAGEPIVDWPGEENRKIVALRLVSAPAARFAGRAVRQALAAEGFVLGKFDIFHKPGPDDRAVLSAASLTKPGTFTMNTIDAQRFGGISLFAVLPGPLPAQETFDELLTTARSLNDRLQGALQDERGEPLTPVRSATIRQSLGPSGDEGGGPGTASPHIRH